MRRSRRLTSHLVTPVVLAALVAACTGGGASPPSTPPTDIATAATAPAGATPDTATPTPATAAPTDTVAPTTTDVPALTGTAIETAPVGEPVSFDVTPEGGGMMAVALGDAGTATLVVPPGAVDSLEVIDLIPVITDTGDYGVLLEPAGVWLSEPAVLRFDGLPGEPLGRVELAASWYTNAATTSDGAIPVIRLRPFLQSTQPEAAVEVDFTQSWDELVAPRFAMIDESDVDPFDLAAAKEEHDAARQMVGATGGTGATSSTTSTTSTSMAGAGGGGGGGDTVPPPSSVADQEGDESNEGDEGDEGDDREDEVRDRANDRLDGGGDGGAGACGDSPSDAAKAVETARTAGARPTSGLPDCIQLSIAVTAQIEFGHSSGHSFQETVETPTTLRCARTISSPGGLTCVDLTVTGEDATASAEGAVSILPLDGEIRGLAQFYSLETTFLGAAFAAMFGQAGRDINDTSCSITRLQGGSVSVRATILPDDQLQVELTPTPGTYTSNCSSWLQPIEAPSLIWDTLAPLLGNFGGEPLQFQMPLGRGVYGLKSLTGSFAQSSGVVGNDGVARYADGEWSISAFVEVHVDYTPAGS